MTREEMQDFEQKLLARGYKRWEQALYGEEDHDVSRIVRDKEGEDKYQIIFKFWDFSIYPQVPEANGYAVDVVIMPCIDGRADLELCRIGKEDKVLNVDWVEGVAKDYYEFITQKLK